MCLVNWKTFPAISVSAMFSSTFFRSSLLINCLFTLFLLPITIRAENAVAQDIYGVNPNNNSKSIVLTAEFLQAPKYRITKAGPKPSLGLSDCSRLHSKSLAARELITIDDDMKIVGEILKLMSPDHGYVLFTIAPSEVMWWVRTLGSISIQSIGVAVHEANHAVNAALTKCNGGAATYSFHGQIFMVDHWRDDTPRYSILESMLPTLFKRKQVGSRYSQYIVRNGSQPGSDFSVLLDELVAYTGAASVESAIFGSNEFRWLIAPEIDALDANSGGMADFMVYVLSYLKAIRISYPKEYLDLQKKKSTLSLLQVVWTDAENSLIALYKYTRLAKRGGVLYIAKEAITTAYSDEFLTELDRLGISHRIANDWFDTYINNTE